MFSQPSYFERTLLCILISGIVMFVCFEAIADTEYYIDTKKVSKVEAVKKLLTQPDAEVRRCSTVELTDKLTLKNKKKDSK